MNVIDILEDSELEFEYECLEDTIFRIVFKIEKNKNHPLLVLIKTNGKSYSTYSAKYIGSKNPILQRIEKLTGYRLDNYYPVPIPGDMSISLRFSK